MKISLNQLHVLTNNRNILYVTNRNSFIANGFDKILKTDENNIFNEFSLNPKLTEVHKACEILKNEQFDFIIGVGGGSAMDFAKMLHYFLELNLDNMSEYLEHIKNPRTQHIKSELILIPTTSGSGSEVTHFSVIYDGEDKLSFAHEILRPKYFILDPVFTSNLPPLITAYTGMDAIVHAVESYWAKESTEQSKENSLNALSLLVPQIKEATFRSSNQSRIAMLEGANLAGMAIDISKTTAAHAFSYYLTTHFEIPHGKAVANMLPFFLIPNGDYPKLNRCFNVANNIELKEAFIKLLKELNLYFDPMEFIKDLDDFIESVNIERLDNNPVKFTKEQLKELFTNN